MTRYEVRLFYAETVTPPKESGALAIHTWNVGELSRDMEIDAGLGRSDIGRIEWRVARGNWVLVDRPGRKP